MLAQRRSGVLVAQNAGPLVRIALDTSMHNCTARTLRTQVVIVRAAEQGGEKLAYAVHMWYISQIRRTDVAPVQTEWKAAQGLSAKGNNNNSPGTLMRQ